MKSPPIIDDDGDGQWQSPRVRNLCSCVRVRDDCATQAGSHRVCCRIVCPFHEKHNISFLGQLGRGMRVELAPAGRASKSHGEKAVVARARACSRDQGSPTPGASRGRRCGLRTAYAKASKGAPWYFRESFIWTKQRHAGYMLSVTLLRLSAASADAEKKVGCVVFCVATIARVMVGG
jgi:hypothetical protein